MKYSNGYQNQAHLRLQSYVSTNFSDNPRSAICPGIVLVFCNIVLENVKLSLKIIKYTDSFPFFWIYVMHERKQCENRWIR